MWVTFVCGHRPTSRLGCAPELNRCVGRPPMCLRHPIHAETSNTAMIVNLAALIRRS